MMATTDYTPAQVLDDKLDAAVDELEKRLSSQRPQAATQLGMRCSLEGMGTSEEFLFLQLTPTILSISCHGKNMG